MNDIYNNHQQLRDQHAIDVCNGNNRGTPDENRKTIKQLKDNTGKSNGPKEKRN